MWTNIHGHSTYSDGLGTPTERIQYALELGQSALGLTDHGTVSGLPEHYEACRKVERKPVLGVEAYHQRVFTRPSDVKEEKEEEQEPDEATHVTRPGRNHLTLLAQTTEGYRNLLRMTTEANQESFYRFPIVTDTLLKKFSAGVVVLSGCLSGHIAKNILGGNLGEAWDFLDFLRDVFGDRLFLEVQPFGGEEQAQVNRQLEVWADIHNFQIVATADSHFIRPGDEETYRIYQRMRTNSGTDSWSFSDRFMPTEEDMVVAWEKLMGTENIQVYLENAHTVAENCDVSLDKAYALPNLPWVKDEQESLVKLCMNGIKRKGLFSQDAQGKHIFPEYEERLRYEVQSLLDRHFAGYILLVAEMVRFCKEHDIACQARGSACGSLVAFLLDISAVNPLRYGLSFERFCSPDRYDLPDVDLDVEPERKAEVVAYMQQQYKAEQISAWHTYKTRGLVNKLSAAVAFENGDALLFREHIGDLDDIPFTYESLLADPVLKKLDKKYQCVSHFCKLYGKVNYVSRHAAGVAVSAGDLTDRVALMRVGGKDGDMLTSYDMDALNIAKVSKVDILGVSNLTICARAERDAGVVFSDSWCQDREVLAAFGRGQTIGIFQFERSVPRTMLKKIAKVRPLTFEDVAVVNACNRPAPKLEKSLDLYVKSITTPGEKSFIYQEDVMDMCRYAGFSWEQVSQVLKMLKRYTVNNTELEEAFIKGMGEKGHAEEESRRLWQSMRRYLFNKSHAVSYTQLACRQMYLKLHYPESFFLALLQCEALQQSEESKHKQRVYMSEGLKTAGLRFLPAHVNGPVNFDRTTISGKNFIQQGLLSLPGIGEKVADAIVAERIAHGEYTGLENLQERLPGRVLNVKVKRVLDEAGASCFNVEQYERHVKLFNRMFVESVNYGL